MPPLRKVLRQAGLGTWLFPVRGKRVASHGTMSSVNMMVFMLLDSRTVSDRREVTTTSCGKASFLFRSTFGSQSQACWVLGHHAVLMSLFSCPYKVYGFGRLALPVVGFDSLLFHPFGDFSEDFVVPPPVLPFCQCPQDVVQCAGGCSTLVAQWVFAPNLEATWGWRLCLVPLCPRTLKGQIQRNPLHHKTSPMHIPLHRHTLPIELQSRYSGLAIVSVSVGAVLISKLLYGTLLWKLKACLKNVAEGQEKELKDSQHTRCFLFNNV